MIRALRSVYAPESRYKTHLSVQEGNDAYSLCGLFFAGYAIQELDWEEERGCRSCVRIAESRYGAEFDLLKRRIVFDSDIDPHQVLTEVVQRLADGHVLRENDYRDIVDSLRPKETEVVLTFKLRYMRPEVAELGPSKMKEDVEGTIVASLRDHLLPDEICWLEPRGKQRDYLGTDILTLKEVEVRA